MLRTQDIEPSRNIPTINRKPPTFLLFLTVCLCQFGIN